MRSSPRGFAIDVARFTHRLPSWFFTWYGRTGHRFQGETFGVRRIEGRKFKHQLTLPL